MLLKATMTSLLLSFVLSADPINVSYTVTGGPGDWTLDFSVNNNLGGAADQDFYFFGVDLSSSSNITGSPTVIFGLCTLQPQYELWGCEHNLQ